MCSTMAAIEAERRDRIPTPDIIHALKRSAPMLEVKSCDARGHRWRKTIEGGATEGLRAELKAGS